STHTEIYTLSLHDALPISKYGFSSNKYSSFSRLANGGGKILLIDVIYEKLRKRLTFFKIWRWVLFICIYTLNIKSMNKIVQILRSEEHTSELQSRENLVCR